MIKISGTYLIGDYKIQIVFAEPIRFFLKPCIVTRVGMEKPLPCIRFLFWNFLVFGLKGKEQS